MRYLRNISRLTIFLLISGFGFASFGQDQNATYSDEELRLLLFGEDFSWEPETENESPAEWTPSLAGKLGIGYSDNPLFGPYLKNDSTYLETSLECFLLRNGNPNLLTYLYLFGEGKLYDQLEEQRSSSLYLGQFDHAYSPNGSEKTFGFRARQTFFNQGFDFSELGLPYSMKIRSSKSELNPYLRSRLYENLEGFIDFSVGKEDFAVIEDDNQEWALGLSIQGKPSLFSWEVSSEIKKKKYETRPKRNWDGSLISLDPMKTKRIESSLKLQKKTENSIFENSTIKFLWSRLNDNGGSYYDYQKFSVSIGQEIKFSKWQLEWEGSGSKTNYQKRKATTGEFFKRQSLKLQAGLTRELTDNLETYLNWSTEEDFSNERDFEYDAFFWSIGINWEL